MTRESRRRTIIAMRTAVRRSGLSRYEVLRCMGRGLVRQPLTGADLAELRRVRRLQDLGVNFAGIEIILRMRRRIIALEAEVAQRDFYGNLPARASGDDRWRRLLSWEPDAEDR